MTIKMQICILIRQEPTHPPGAQAVIRRSAQGAAPGNPNTRRGSTPPDSGPAAQRRDPRCGETRTASGRLHRIGVTPVRTEQLAIR